MPPEKQRGPRVGPWLRSYGAPSKPPWRERVATALIGLGVAAAFGVVLIGVFWSFVRWPLFTLAGLAVIWILGMVVFTVRRQRARLRNQLLRRVRQSSGRTGL